MNYLNNYITTKSWAINLESALSYYYTYVFNSNTSNKPSEDDLKKNSEYVSEHVLNGLSYSVYNNPGLSRINEISKDSIVKLVYRGVMMSDDGWCVDGIESLSNRLYSCYENPNIKGIIMDIKSGGGESEAGELLYSAVSDKNKPVVVHTHYLGSAALYGSLPATEIHAYSNSSKIGSIGSYYSIDLESLEYLKKNIMFIYGDNAVGKNSEFRQLLSGNYEGITKLANKSTNEFRELVAQHRKLNIDSEKDKDTLSGSMFNAIDSYDRNLIDGITTRMGILNSITNLIKYDIK